MSTIAAFLLAAQGPAPVWLVEARDAFVSACVDGTLRTETPVQEIQLADLPGAVRRRYRRNLSGHFYRLGTERPSYLVQVTSSDSSSQFSAICGLAVPGRNRLLTLALNVIRPISDAARDDGVENREIISGIIVGDYVVLEILHFAPGEDPTAWPRNR